VNVSAMCGHCGGSHSNQTTSPIRF